MYAQAEPGGHPEPARGERPVILIVDDDKGLNGIVTRHLHSRGFAVEQAFGPDEAMERILACNPDLVVMDACLPGASGPEVLERAAAAGFRPPALVVSGHAELLAPDGQETARIVRRLNKPLPLAMLADFVAAFLARERAAG